MSDEQAMKGDAVKPPPGVRLLERSSDAGMVAEFLRAEFRSASRGQQIRGFLDWFGWPTELVELPDLADPVADARRAHVLGGMRGWGVDWWIFEGFPTAVEWWHGELDSAILPEALAIDLGGIRPWREVSGGSRRAGDAAVGIRAKSDWSDEDVRAFVRTVRGIEAAYRAGEPLNRPILVAPGPEGPLVALEGHKWIVARLLSGRGDPLPVLLGFSERIREWRWWGDTPPDGAEPSARRRAPFPMTLDTNVLYYGDNLPILEQHIPAESVDLV